MCRVVDVGIRSGWFRGKFRIRCLERRRHCYQRGAVGYWDECDPGVHVG